MFAIAQMIEYLLANPGLEIEIQGPVICCWRSSRSCPSDKLNSTCND